MSDATVLGKIRIPPNLWKNSGFVEDKICCTVLSALKTGKVLETVKLNDQVLEAKFKIEPCIFEITEYCCVVVLTSETIYSTFIVGVDDNVLENSAVSDTVSLGSTILSCLSAKVNSSLNAYCPVPVFLITLLP